MSAEHGYREPCQVRWQPVVLQRRPAEETPPAHLRPRPGHVQTIVLPGMTVTGVRDADEAAGQRLRLAQAACLMYQAQCVVLYQVASTEPTELL